jgi:hypothetical protein
MSTIHIPPLASALIRTCLAALLVTGCTHHTAATSNALSEKLAPFAQTRNQAIAMVTDAKHAFDAPSINQLMLAYTDLETKSNAYAGFLVEATNVDSFDTQKNDEYAARLRNAIAAFNVTYTTLARQSLVNPKGNTRLSDTWVAPFAQSVQAYWTRYHNALASSPQTVAYVAQQIKSDTIYPNFEDIATERVR